MSVLEQALGGSRHVVGFKDGGGNKSFGLSRRQNGIGVFKVWLAGRIGGVSAIGSSWDSSGGPSVVRGGWGAGKFNLCWSGGWNMLGLCIVSRAEENSDNILL